MIVNIDGYKMIFFIENLLREYISTFSLREELNPNFIEKAEKNAIENGILDTPIPLTTILKYTHLGELIDVIKSSQFSKLKYNEIKRVTIGPLITHRNNVMHSRAISAEEMDQIRINCEEIVRCLQDSNFTIKWNNFLSNDIKNFQVPHVYLEYKFGKNFEKLIGRHEELTVLKERIKAPFPISVVGHGGLGKTALTLQLIEDLVYSPEQPFERFFFMSFKNTVFENGAIRRFEKIISNHTDLIYKLASCMGFEFENRSFEELEILVWDEIFSKRTLLILDNLETEIVQSNLTEFTEIAQRFISNFNRPSRLIITSRYGLGDKETKLPLYQFDLNKTKELMSSYYGGEALKNKKLLPEDWDWIQGYTQGNPGLIIAFSNTLRSTRKQVKDLRIEYNSQYTSESQELHNQLDEFLGFCFENTIESMKKESQIFLSILCYLCSKTSISEINEELLTYLKDELNLQKLGDENLRAHIFVNIGFLQPKHGTDRYYANELVIEYMNGNFSNSDNVFTVFKLRESEWYREIERIKTLINEVQFDEEYTLGRLISELYLLKYRRSKHSQYLLKSFFCHPTLDTLFKFYKQLDEASLINHFNLLDKVPKQLKDEREFKRQEQIVFEIISALLKVNQKILSREITHFRQSELFDYYKQLSNKVSVMQKKELNVSLRKLIIKFLLQQQKYEIAESLLIDNEQMLEDRFNLYVKQVGELAGKDLERCSSYIEECSKIIKGNTKIRKVSRAQFIIYSARYFKKTNPSHALKQLENFEEYLVDNNVSLYIFYLESLLIRIECLIIMKEPINKIQPLVERFKKQSNSPQYSKIFHKKKSDIEDNFRKLDRMIKQQYKKSK